jgi:small subunit ribosomal protein S14
MAKRSIVVRDLKRQKMIKQYAAKRAELKALGWKNRCSETGRPRSYMRTFGLSRLSFREHASKGEIPGVTKSSW